MATRWAASLYDMHAISMMMRKISLLYYSRYVATKLGRPACDDFRLKPQNVRTFNATFFFFFDPAARQICTTLFGNKPEFFVLSTERDVIVCLQCNLIEMLLIWSILQSSHVESPSVVSHSMMLGIHDVSMWTYPVFSSLSLYSANAQFHKWMRSYDVIGYRERLSSRDHFSLFVVVAAPLHQLLVSLSISSMIMLCFYLRLRWCEMWNKQPNFFGNWK